MYNCLKLCQRLISPMRLENQLKPTILLNRSLISRLRLRNSLKLSSTVSGTVLQKNQISNFDDLVVYVRNTRRIELEHISQVLNRIGNDDVREEHVLFLLECCGKAIPGETLETKHEICQMVFEKFKSCLKYSDRIYQTYINVCTDNKQVLDVNKLILSIANNITFDVLKLLLKNVCENGDIQKALSILAEMKNRGYPADDQVFNDLVLCHTLKGGLKSGESVLKTMLMAKLSQNNRTRFAIIKGLAQRKDSKELIGALDKYPVMLNEDMLLELVESMGFTENHTYISYITKPMEKHSYSRNFFIELEKLCMNLVHNKKYDSAMAIFKMFIEPKPDDKYGGSILREMLICSAPIEKIVEFAKELKESGLNEYALEDVTDLALKYKLTISAMKLLKFFDTLRPHYFWPILLKAHASGGEKGLMEVIKNVKEMNVMFDTESFQYYIFPYCDLKNPQRIIQSFQSHGYTVRMLLTPMIWMLLQKKNTKLAMEVCKSYDVQIESQDLMNVLPQTWISTDDHDACLTLIQKMSEFKSELIFGNFLTQILSKLKSPSRLRGFLQLLQDSKRRKLIIDNGTAETLLLILKKNFPYSQVISEIEDAVNDLLDFSKVGNASHILHPRDMDTEQLECHLIELKSKGMETRGLIRRLIQRCAKEGKVERVHELEKELTAKNYNTSSGTKSAIMYTNIQSGNLSAALEMYDNLKQFSPQFKIDVYKIIDLATLLVKNNKFDKAIDLLEKEAKERNITPGKYLERNSKVLLSSIDDLEEQDHMFNVLLKNGYCDPYNIILGSIIQLHLEKGTLKNTVDLFVNFAEKYRQTPMQITLLTETLKSKDQELFKRVLDATALVHGTAAAHAALITAFCEGGYKKQLIAFLKDSQLNPKHEMEKRCDRWAKINQMDALQTLLEVSREVSPVILNTPKIQLSIMQIYSKNNDCDGALKFWKNLVDHEDLISNEVEMEFNNLLERCKYDVPKDLELKYRIK